MKLEINFISRCNYFTEILIYQDHEFDNENKFGNKMIIGNEATSYEYQYVYAKHY